MDNANRHEAVRLQLLGGGYDPIPVNGKEPNLVRWQMLTGSTPGDIIRWTSERRDETNTGVLTKKTPTFDIDIPVQAAADAIEQLVRDRYADCGVLLTRFGRAPKRAIPFRTDTPFKKKTATLVASSGEKHRLEFLADGQQFIADGIHPDTRKPYQWFGGELAAVGREKLPCIDEAEAQKLVDDAIDLLVKEHGYTLEEKSRPRDKDPPPRSEPRPGDVGPRERAYAEAALRGRADELAAMAPGSGRNDAALRAATRLGTMVAAGWIDTRTVEDELAAAAEAKGKSKHNARGTVRRGLGYGAQYPAGSLDEADAAVESATAAANKTGAETMFGGGAETVEDGASDAKPKTAEAGTQSSDSQTKADGHDAGEEDLGARSSASGDDRGEEPKAEDAGPRSSASKSDPEGEQADDSGARSWLTPLKWRECKKGNKPTASLHNARVAIARLGIECRYDLFHEKVLVGHRGGEVWHAIPQLVGELSDIAETRLRQMVSERFGFDPTAAHIHDAIKTLATDHCFDPVLDLLDEAQAAWDGKPRLDAWVVTYLGCADTKLNRAIGRKVLIAGVRRARDPGCKFDNITVLEGDEGLLKSTVIRILAGDENFSDQSLLGAHDKEVQELLAGVWMHENADLAGMRRADVEHVKAFASRQVDRARPAYGRNTEWRKRRSIEWGTTNNSEYLQSQTGNRRFWPLRVGRVIKIDELTRDRLQLLGEAATYEDEGESLVLDRALWPDAAEAQEARRVKHPWEDILADIPEFVSIWTDDDKGTRQQKPVRIIHHHENDGTEMVVSRELLEHVLKVPAARQTVADSMRLADAMRALKWQRSSSGRVAIGGVRVRGFWRVGRRPPFQVSRGPGLGPTSLFWADLGADQGGGD